MSAATGTEGLTQVTMPQLGESVTEGQISRWLKQPGDRVEKYEALVEVITDKVNAEVPSPVAGVLAEINVQEGETVAVGTLICSIGSDGGGTGREAAVPGAASAATQPDFTPEPARAPEPAPVLAPPATATPAPAAPALPGSGDGGRASPAVRRLASEHGIDISLIQGSGIRGRVTKRDVDEFLAGEGAAQVLAVPLETAARPPAEPVPARSVAAAASIPKQAAGDELIPLTPMRKAIAEHMVRSRQTSPHAWCATEVDMTGVVALRVAKRDDFLAREGVALTYVPFVIKAAVEALKQHPEVNATFTPEGILRRRAINISVAVGLDDGLIVPVVRDADMLSIAGLAHKLTDLANRARAGQLKLEDVEGGTFCVNNPGTYGTVISAAIINQPQAAIMTMEAIIKRAVVLPGDVIGIRSMMFLGLSFDHRVMDGLQAASFIGDVKKALEVMDDGTPVY